MKNQGNAPTKPLSNNQSSKPVESSNTNEEKQKEEEIDESNLTPFQRARLNAMRNEGSTSSKSFPKTQPTSAPKPNPAEKQNDEEIDESKLTPFQRARLAAIRNQK